MTTEAPSKPTLDERFTAYHEANPQVYRELVSLAREVKAQGQKAGIGMLWEVMRWRIFFQTKDPDGWKLNNDYRSRYARLMMEQEEDLAGFFDIRELRS